MTVQKFVKTEQTPNCGCVTGGGCRCNPCTCKTCSC